MEVLGRAEIQPQRAVLVARVEEVELDAYAEDVELAALVVQSEIYAERVRRETYAHFRRHIGQQLFHSLRRVGRDETDQQAHEARADRKRYLTGGETEQHRRRVGIFDVRRFLVRRCQPFRGSGRAGETAEQTLRVQKILQRVGGHVDLDLRARAEQPGEVGVKRALARLDIAVVVKPYEVPEPVVAALPDPGVDRKIDLGDPEGVGARRLVAGRVRVAEVVGHLRLDLEEDLGAVVLAYDQHGAHVAHYAAEDVVDGVYAAHDLDILAVRRLLILFAHLVKVVASSALGHRVAGQLLVVLEGDKVLAAADGQAAAQRERDGVELCGVHIIYGLGDEHMRGHPAVRRLIILVAHEAARIGIPGVQDLVTAVNAVLVIGPGDAFAAAETHPSVFDRGVLVVEIGGDARGRGIRVGLREVDEHLGIAHRGRRRLFADIVGAVRRPVAGHGGVDRAVSHSLVVLVGGHGHIVDEAFLPASHRVAAAEVVTFVMLVVLAVLVLVEVAVEREVLAAEVHKRVLPFGFVKGFRRELVDILVALRVETYARLHYARLHLFGSHLPVGVVERARLGQVDGYADLVLPEVEFQLDERVPVLGGIDHDDPFAVVGGGVAGVVELDMTVVTVRDIVHIGAYERFGDAESVARLHFDARVTLGVAPIGVGRLVEAHILALDIEVEVDGGDGVVVRVSRLDLRLILRGFALGHAGAQLQPAVVAQVVDPVLVIDLAAEAGVGVHELLVGRVGRVEVLVVVDIRVDGERRLLRHFGEQIVLAEQDAEQAVEIVAVHQHLDEGAGHPDAVEEGGDIARDLIAEQRQTARYVAQAYGGRSVVLVRRGDGAGAARRERLRGSVCLAHEVADKVLKLGQSDVDAGLSEIAEVDIETRVLTDMGALVVVVVLRDGVHIRRIVAVQLVGFVIALDVGDESDALGVAVISVRARLRTEEVGVQLFAVRPVFRGRFAELAAHEVDAEDVVHGHDLIAVHGHGIAVGDYPDRRVDELEQVFQTHEVVGFGVFVVDLSARVGHLGADDGHDRADEGEQIHLVAESEQGVTHLTEGRGIHERMLSRERAHVVEEGAQPEFHRDDEVDVTVEVAAGRGVLRRGYDRDDVLGSALEQIAEQPREVDVRVFAQQQIQRQRLAETDRLGGVEVHILLEFGAGEYGLMFGDEAELEVLDAEREIQLRVVRAHVELVAVLPLVDGVADGVGGDFGGGQLLADIPVRGSDIALVVGIGLGGAKQTVLAVRGDRVLAVLAFREGVVARFLGGVLVLLERVDLRLDGFDVLFRQFDGHIAIAFEGESRAYLHIQRFAVVDLDVEFAVQVLVDEVGKGDAADVERAQDIAHEIVADMEGEAAFADDQARHLVLHGSDVRLFALLVGGETFRLGGSARDDDGVEDGTVKQVAEIFVDEPADLVERRGYPRQPEEGHVEVHGHAAVIRAQPQHFGSGFVGQVVKLDVQLGLRQVVHVEHDVQVEPEVRRGVALGGLGHLDGHAADGSDDVFEEAAEVKHAFGYAELELDRGAQADDGIVEGRERHRLFAVGSLTRGDERRNDGALRVSADFDLYGAELEPEALGRAVSAQHRAHSEEERRVTGVKFDKDIKLIENVGQAAEVGHEGGDEQTEDGLGRHYLQTFGGKQRLQQRVAHRAVRGGIRLGGSRRFRPLLFPGLFGGVLKRFRHESGEAGHLSVVVGDAEDVGAVEIQVAVLDVDARHRLVVAFGDIAALGFIGGVGGELEVLVKFDELERYLEAGHAFEQRDDEFLGVERAVFVLAGVEVDLRELGKIQTRGQAEAKTRGHAVLYAEVDIEVVDVDGKQRAEQRIDRAAELVIRLAVRVEVDPAHYAELDGLGSRVGIGGGAVHESEDALDRGSDVGEGRARLFVDESANGAGESYVKPRAQSEIQRHAVLEHGVDRELEKSPALILRLQFEADGAVLGEQQFARGDLGADELTEHRRQHIRAEGDVRAQAAGEQIAAHVLDGGAEGHALDDAVDQREHGVEHGRFCGRAVCAVRRHAFCGRGRL